MRRAHVACRLAAARCQPPPPVSVSVSHRSTACWQLPPPTTSARADPQPHQVLQVRLCSLVLAHLDGSDSAEPHAAAPPLAQSTYVLRAVRARSESLSSIGATSAGEGGRHNAAPRVAPASAENSAAKALLLLLLLRPRDSRRVAASWSRDCRPARSRPPTALSCSRPQPRAAPLSVQRVPAAGPRGIRTRGHVPPHGLLAAIPMSSRALDKLWACEWTGGRGAGDVTRSSLSAHQDQRTNSIRHLCTRSSC